MAWALFVVIRTLQLQLGEDPETGKKLEPYEETPDTDHLFGQWFWFGYVWMWMVAC